MWVNVTEVENMGNCTLWTTMIPPLPPSPSYEHARAQRVLVGDAVALADEPVHAFVVVVAVAVAQAALVVAAVQQVAVAAVVVVELAALHVGDARALVRLCTEEVKKKKRKPNPTELLNFRVQT